MIDENKFHRSSLGRVLLLTPMMHLCPLSRPPVRLFPPHLLPGCCSRHALCHSLPLSIFAAASSGCTRQFTRKLRSMKMTILPLNTESAFFHIQKDCFFLFSPQSLSESYLWMNCRVVKSAEQSSRLRSSSILIHNQHCSVLLVLDCIYKIEWNKMPLLSLCTCITRLNPRPVTVPTSVWK